MLVRFNPPPGWPLPADWSPPPGWEPDPRWPAPPPGWQFWVPAEGRPSPPPRRRRGTAVAAVVGAALLATVLGFGIAQLVQRPGDPGVQQSTTEPGTSDSAGEPETYTITNPDTGLLSAELGACTTSEGRTADTVSSLPLMDCTLPHDAQVVGLFDLEGEDYPGVDAVQQQSVDGCESAFEDFIGVPYSQSELRVWYLSPNQETWESDGDREVICIAYLEGAEVTQSWEGTGT